MSRKRRWDADELVALVQRYPTEGPERLAIEFARSASSVISQAARFHLPSLTRRERQSDTRMRRRQERQRCQKDEDTP